MYENFEKHLFDYNCFICCHDVFMSNSRKKEYNFELTGENSGRLTIRYINILSVMDDGQDVTTADFQELLDKYINGDQILQDYPGATNIKTRLFEDNNQLCGEVSLDFADLSSARLYQYDKKKSNHDVH